MYRYLLINDAEIRVEKYEIKKEEKDDPDDWVHQIIRKILSIKIR